MPGLGRSASTQCLPAVAVVTAGGLGGMAYWVVIFPVDVIKSAMQTDAIVKSERKYPDMLTTTQVRPRAVPQNSRRTAEAALCSPLGARQGLG